jgi:hypothetical protein
MIAGVIRSRPVLGRSTRGAAGGGVWVAVALTP